MKNGCWFLCLLAALGFSIASNAQQLQLLTENFPPINMSESGKNFAKGAEVTGIAPDLVRLMCQKASIDCTITLKFPWSRIYSSALKRANYGIFSAAKTDERLPHFKWVGPITQMKTVIYALPGSSLNVSGIEDLKGLRVGGYKGDATTVYLQENGVNVNAAFEDSQNVTKLKKGQIDVWATGSLSGHYFAKKAGVTSLEELWIIETVDLWLAINKDTSDDIVNRMNDALKTIKSSAEYENIHAKYR